MGNSDPIRPAIESNDSSRVSSGTHFEHKTMELLQSIKKSLAEMENAHVTSQ
jgi:hypothetical protein